MVKLHNTEGARVVHITAKDGCSRGAGSGLPQLLFKPFSKENIVSQCETHAVAAYEALAQNKGVRNAAAVKLPNVGYVCAEAVSVPQQALELGKLVGRDNDENVSDTKLQQD